jgi:Glycosyl transferases group 1
VRASREPAPAAPIGGSGTKLAGAESRDGRTVDVLIVSLGSTGGLRAVDAELAGSLRRVGASVVLAYAKPPRRRLRTLALTDLAWALAARRAASAALAEHEPSAVIYSTTTAALLWPRPGTIRFDAPNAGNRPGRHGLWQRPLERRRLGQAALLLPQSQGALDEAPRRARARVGSLVLPVPVEPSGPLLAAAERDIAAVTYAANPLKKGLDRVLRAWTSARRPGEELLVAGISEQALQGARIALPSEGVRLTGLLAPSEYRALLRRARVFVCAPCREDHGIAQLEALADGCQLVTSSAPGPYVALPIARALDPRLVTEDLAGALRAALDEPAPDYPTRAARALAPFSRAVIDRIVRDELLARLLDAAPG